METEKSIVKTSETRLPKFVESAYDSIEQMQAFANVLLESKLVPSHFYEKLPDGKPDFTKGKTPAVVAVLIQGYQLQLPPLTALQHIIPVNGLLSIKGDLAKSMIFNSGKLKPGSWVEEETGSMDEGNLIAKITATRSDNGQTLSRSFSVAQAKRAGLWITEQQVNGQDGWKYKASAWWKYPARMINYRALGFLARDMFPDVMAGIYTTEEAMDIPQETVEVIKTDSGATITIPDKEHAKKRSDKMTERVVDKIPDNRFGEVSATILQPTVINESHPEEKKDGFNDSVKDMFVQVGEAIEGGASDKAAEAITDPNYLSDEKLNAMETKQLLEIVNGDMDMMEAMEMIPGKNTSKKLLTIIRAHREGKLAELVAPHIKQENEENQGVSDAGMKPAKDFDKKPGEVIEKNKDIMQPEKKVETGNKYKIEVPPYDKGEGREFGTVKNLFNKLMGVEPQITTPRYMDIAAKLGLIKKYPDKEALCKYGTVEEINEVLNAN